MHKSRCNQRILMYQTSVIFVPDTVTAEQQERATAYRSHGHLIPPRFAPEPPSLPDSPTKGCCDWTEVALSSCVSWLTGCCPDFQAHIVRSLIPRSWRMACVAAGLLPTAGFMYSCCWYSVFKIQQKLLFVLLHLYRNEIAHFTTLFFKLFHKFSNFVQ